MDNLQRDTAIEDLKGRVAALEAKLDTSAAPTAPSPEVADVRDEDKDSNSGK